MINTDDFFRKARVYPDFENEEETLTLPYLILPLHYDQASLNFGLQASKQIFLKNIEKPYDIVHLALHATSSQSGAEFVVGSLWSLPDFSSAQLINRFYANIKAGQSPPVALGGAKRDFLVHADSYTAQPFYWAGLTAYGH